jgi:hypothetical protein
VVTPLPSVAGRVAGRAACEVLPAGGFAGCCFGGCCFGGAAGFAGAAVARRGSPSVAGRVCGWAGFAADAVAVGAAAWGAAPMRSASSAVPVGEPSRTSLGR